MLNLIRVYAVLSAPFIPDAATAMLAAMGTDDDRWPDDLAAALRSAAPGPCLRRCPRVLFAKITDEDREDWQARFSGVRS